MITKYIIYKGKSSAELGLRLIDDIEFSSSSQNIEFVDINGVNGSKIKDNKRLSLVDRSFPFSVYNETDINNIITKLNEWLLTDNTNWDDFELSWDSDYLYKAMFYETFNVKGTIHQKKKCILNFKIHPIKYLKSGQEKISINKGQQLINPEKRASKPLIKLTGTGDVTLTINQQLFNLKGVQGHILIDCENQSAYYGDNESQYDKVYSYPFPVLEVGRNIIDWNNPNFIVEITPRWEAIV